MGENVALEIIITATDRASRTVRGIGQNMSSAFELGGKIAVGGLLGVAGALGLVIREGMEGERVQAQLNAVLESTGGVAGWSAGEANSLADSLSRVTTFSADAVVGGQSLLLTFTNIGEDIMPLATETMLDMSTAMGTDLKGSSIQLGKALNDPIKGVSALSEVGVNFSDAQKEMIEQMVEAGDVAGAQTIILDELQKEFGGSARAAGDTFGGKLTILRHKLMDVVETLGMRMMPALGAFADLLIDSIIPASEEIGKDLFPIIQTGFGFIADRVRELADLIVPFVKKHLKGFQAALIALGVVLTGLAIAGGLISIAGALMTLLNPITLVIAGIALLAFAWEEDLFGMKTFFMNNIWPPLKEAFADFAVRMKETWEVAKVVWTGISAILSAAWEIMRPILKSIAEWLIEAIPVALEFLWGIFQTAWELIAAGINWWWNNVTLPIFNALKSFLEITIPIAIGAAKTAWDGLKSAFEAISGSWNDTVKPALDDLISFLGESLKNAIDTVKPIIEGIGTALSGVATDFYLFLKPVLESIQNWFITTIPNAVTTLATGAWDLIKTAWNGLKTAYDTVFKPIFQNIWDFMQMHIPGAWNTVRDTVFSAMEEWFGLVKTAFETHLKPALQAIFDFMEMHIPAAWNTVRDTVFIALEAVFTTVKEVFDTSFRPALQAIFDFLESWLPGAFETAKEKVFMAFRTAMLQVKMIYQTAFKPMLDAMVTFFTATIPNAVTSLVDGAFSTLEEAFDGLRGVLNNLKSAFDSIKGAFEDILGPISDIGDAIKNTYEKIPSQLRPGSPPPFAVGLWDIASGARDIDASFMALSRNPVFSRNIDAPSNTFNLTINSNAADEDVQRDFEMMKTWGGI